jgi:hypothetical protein
VHRQPILFPALAPRHAPDFQYCIKPHRTLTTDCHPSSLMGQYFFSVKTATMTNPQLDWLS